MKVAIFVEGMTEEVFVVRLLKELAGASNCLFTVETYRKKSFTIITTDAPTGQRHEFLVVDCGSDSSVLTAILDRRGSLANAAFEAIYGLRDLYPHPDEELQQIQADIDAVIPVGDPPIEIFIAKREVEAWFIQEDLHFPKIDPAINRTSIVGSLNFDIEVDSAESINHPADFLKRCYSIAGKSYKKRRKSVSRTVSALDIENLYVNRLHLVPSLGNFVNRIEALF